MPTHERSQFGCWTCRVRKKKCDEQYPICRSCSSRGITCHGYGPKPDWVDGREQERKVLEELKLVVKENLKQRRPRALSVQPRRATDNSFHHRHFDTRQDHFPTALKIDTSYEIIATPAQPPLITNTPSCLGDPGSISALPAPPDGSLISERNASSKELETVMLMNYLDHVFPLQFNCYTPPVLELGRGWLLALLTRTKPLYHAALALSAFYMHAELRNTGRTLCMNSFGEEMKTHHALACKELQIQITTSNGLVGACKLKESIEILACIIQLISFELLGGGTDSWQIHMQAASSIVPALGAAREMIDYSQQNISASSMERFEQGKPPPDVNETACEFLVGAFIWFDILSCASTRSMPFLVDNFEYLRNIKLEKLMGCENWVMIIIAKISQMEQWKRDLQKTGRLSMVELGRRGSEIEKLLNGGLINHSICPDSTAGQALGNFPRRNTSIITRIFGYAALTYLHTVVSGAHPELPEIKTSVSMTIAALSNLPDAQLLRNLVWPFCVTGCLASKEQEPFFRSLLCTAGIDGEYHGNYCKVFEVIKECWAIREKLGQEHISIDWTSAMSSLGFHVMLI